MDKNMIHIDELVRSRLQGGEEKERAGGWMAMRDLLDKEMPEAVAATGNRRLYGLLLLLLIGTSLTVAGYQIAIRNGHNDAPGGTMLASAAGNYTAVPNIAARRAEAGEALDKASPINNAAADNSNTTSITPSSRHAFGGPSLQSNAAKAGSVMTGDQQDMPASASNNIQNSKTTAGVIKKPVQHSVAMNTAPAAMMPLPTGKGPSVPQAEHSTMASSSVSDKQVVTPDGLHLLLRRDSIQRIEIVQHRSRQISDGDITTPASLSYDTISMAMLAIYKPLAPAVIPANDAAVAVQQTKSQRRRAASAAQNTTPLKTASALAATDVVAPPAAMPKPDLVAAAMNPAAALANASVADDGNTLVSLSSLTTSSVKHSWWNPEHFNEVVNDVKFRIGGIEWYGGIEAGINGSFGNGHSLGGFQCAVTGLVAINETLSVNTGLYFYQRYNTGSTVHDNYIEVDPTSIHYTPVIINNISYNRYSWTEDSIDHHFNYDVMRTLELPVMLRVSPGGRFFGEGGVNLVYGFKTAASEITNHAEKPVTQTQAYPTSQADPHFGSQSMVKLDDFGSRLGIGFVAGGGYHFSPAVTVNLRMTKTLWDNAGTEGSKKVSQDLFRLPNVQLSVGYRFSQQRASRPADR